MLNLTVLDEVRLLWLATIYDLKTFWSNRDIHQKFKDSKIYSDRMSKLQGRNISSDFAQNVRNPLIEYISFTYADNLVERWCDVLYWYFHFIYFSLTIEWVSDFQQVRNEFIFVSSYLYVVLMVKQYLFVLSREAYLFNFINLLSPARKTYMYWLH